MTSDQAAYPPNPAPKFRENLSGFPWVRLGLAVFFGLALWLVFWAALLTAAAQFVVRLFSGETAEGLKGFGAGLGRYAGQTVGYLTFAHDERPFPFGAFPKP